jgi:hypothetical protein
MRRCSGLSLAVLLLAAACGEDRNFAQRPGFAEYFAAHPPAATIPDGHDRELLERFRPRFFKAPGDDGPIDFYADYVAHARLHGPDGRLIADRVTPEVLNAHKDTPGVVLAHERPEGATGTPVAYGRVDRERVGLGGEERALTFLTYNLVFRTSGLPAGLPRWAEVLAEAVASPSDWHQLDHYTAVSLALDEAGRPFAATFQEHNTLRTWVLGDGIELPPDGRLRVAIARRSNELYPWAPAERRWRTIGSPDAERMRFLMTGEAGPWLRADDVTVPGEEVAYRLAFLPPSDAFYRFQGFLGERRLLPGRDGPPGADYNAPPPLKPKALQMLAGFWRDGDAGDLARFDATRGAGRPALDFALAQAEPFYRAWRCAAGDPAACREAD